MSEQEYLVIINISPLLEEAMVDCLLAIEVDGFNSQPISAHGSEYESLSLAEQVVGRKNQIQFQMYVYKQQLSALIEQLKTNFSGAGIHYWVMPVLESGCI